MLKKFHCHQNILKIQGTFNTPKFSFHEVTDEEVRKEIKNQVAKKPPLLGDIPTGMLKSTMDIHTSVLTEIINLSLRNGCLPDYLKLAEVSAICKENEDSDKDNFRSNRVLPYMSKVLERITYIQIDGFMKDKL